MIFGSSPPAFSVSPNVLDYVSLIWKISMMGTPLEIPQIDCDEDVEKCMAYWREDAALNVYHWHWHVAYFSGEPTYTHKVDRRGELFYYIHQQVIARYNVERLCNRLNLTQPFTDWDKPIEQAYDPILNSYVASKNYPSRLAKAKLMNVNRTDLNLEVSIDDLRRYKKRIFEAIYQKKAITPNGTEIPLDNDQGIDILGNMVESSITSPNEEYYGSIHNDGHSMISLVHDPENKYNQTPGVMYNPSTAMRDPIFYMWHSFLHIFFNAHKASLPSYTEDILTFPGVQVTNVELISHQYGQHAYEKNTLHTYMMKSDIKVRGGLDLTPRDAVLIRTTHVNHDEFDYFLDYVNNFPGQLLGTVRIFLLPVTGFDKSHMTLSEQRPLAIEMDKFVVPLKPGTNRIFRRSTVSSVTIPFDQTFHDVSYKEPNDLADNFDEYAKYYFCGCGWPQHLLVPRGTAEGFPMLLFAMITDASVDRVDPTGDVDSKPVGCKPSESFCGLLGKKYPDKRPTGFPFDRPARNGVDTIEDFLTPNMAIKPITIIYSNEVRPGRLLSHATPIIVNKNE